MIWIKYLTKATCETKTCSESEHTTHTSNSVSLKVCAASCAIENGWKIGSCNIKKERIKNKSDFDEMQIIWEHQVWHLTIMLPYLYPHHTNYI